MHGSRLTYIDPWPRWPIQKVTHSTHPLLALHILMTIYVTVIKVRPILYEYSLNNAVFGNISS